MRTIVTALFLCVSGGPLFSQNIPRIKVRKNGPIAFYQKGRECDTLYRGRTDLFYLIVPNDLRPHIVINVDNAALRTTDNDSIVRLEHVTFHSYRSIYEDVSSGKQGHFKLKKDKWEKKDSIPTAQASEKIYRFITEINGANSRDQNKIFITFTDRLTSLSETWEYFAGPPAKNPSK